MCELVVVTEPILANPQRNSYSDETLSGENTFMYQLQTFEEVVVGQIWPRLLQVIAFRRPINSFHTFSLRLKVSQCYDFPLEVRIIFMKNSIICIKNVY